MQSAEVIPFPYAVDGLTYCPGLPPLASPRPLAGTIDPCCVPVFLAFHGEVSTHGIAHRFGWATKEAYAVCMDLKRQGRIVSRVEPYEDGIVCIWRNRDAA